jgi:hypothetical protein
MRVVQGWPGLFFYAKDVCTRMTTLHGRLWEHCSHYLTYSHALRIFALEAVQDGIRPCHSKCRTVLYHHISGERKSETGRNSPQVTCTVWGRDLITCKCMIGATSFLKAVNRSLTDHMLMCSWQLSQMWTFVAFQGAGFGKQTNCSMWLHPKCG